MAFHSFIYVHKSFSLKSSRAASQGSQESQYGEQLVSWDELTYWVEKQKVGRSEEIKVKTDERHIH